MKNTQQPSSMPVHRYRPYRERVTVCRGYFFRTRGTAGPSVLDVLAHGLGGDRPPAARSLHFGRLRSPPTGDPRRAS